MLSGNLPDTIVLTVLTVFDASYARSAIKSSIYTGLEYRPLYIYDKRVTSKQCNGYQCIEGIFNGADGLYALLLHALS